MSERPTVADMLAEFHRVYGQPGFGESALSDGRIRALREALMREELEETCRALAACDIVGLADGLADLTYVVYGTALVYGIDLDKVIAEVHSSNMSKLSPYGHPILREDGKVLKGPNYRPPDVAGVLARSRISAEIRAGLEAFRDDPTTSTAYAPDPEPAGEAAVREDERERATASRLTYGRDYTNETPCRVCACACGDHGPLFGERGHCHGCGTDHEFLPAERLQP